MPRLADVERCTHARAPRQAHRSRGHLEGAEKVPQDQLQLHYLLKSAAIVAYTAIAFLFTSGFIGLPSSISLTQDQHVSMVRKSAKVTYFPMILK